MTDIQERSIEYKVDRMLAIMQGNELDENDNGMIGKLQDLSVRLENLEKIKNRIQWVVFGMAIPTGVGITKIIALLGDKIFHV